ncbi:MAG: hypothetical protein UY60_C0002G0071, partial [Parcubacteria group bacterium GW2011_GWB1_50_9]
MDDIKKRVFFRHIVRDAAIIALGIFFAVFLEKSGAIERFLDLTRGFFPLVSFVAGMFFTSIFTTVFAT